MSKISELSDGGSLQSTDYLIAVRSGGNVKVQPAGMTFSSVTITSSDINGGNIDGTVIGAATPAAGSFTTGQFGTSLNVDGTVTADGLVVNSGSTGLYASFNSTNANGGYLTISSSGTVHGDIGTAAQIVSGGSASDFGINARGSRNLIFGTNNNERARIDSSGNLLVGTTNPDLILTSGTHGCAIRGAIGFIASNRASDSSAAFGRTTTSGSIVEFYYNGVSKGNISTNGTIVSYNISSDARLKENIADAEDASELIDAIQVRSFDWKADGSHQRYGMVAQELLEVAPEAVSGDPESDDMMGVDYSKLVPMLVKEIQSLRARVAQLEGA